MIIETTNAHGIRFYMEQATDFADNGAVIQGKGWFAGLVVGSDMLAGTWFASRDDAETAIREYRG